MRRNGIERVRAEIQREPFPAPTSMDCVTCGKRGARGNGRPYCIEHSAYAQRVLAEIKRQEKNARIAAGVRATLAKKKETA